MKIIKSFRKTLSVKIDKSGEIIVKSPIFMSKKRIEDFLKKHKIWIEENRKKILKNKKKFEIWEKFYFFGETCPLNPLQTSPLTPLLWEERGKIFASFSFKGEGIQGWGIFSTNLQNPQEIKEAFIQFYKKEAKKYIIPRVLEISEKLDLKFNKIRITSAKTRWWSCSSKKNLNFSWKLILTEKKAIDYVIIHELAHLTEMNHSKNFWSLVEKYSEIIWNWDYKEHKKYLKDFEGVSSF